MVLFCPKRVFFESLILKTFVTAFAITSIGTGKLILQHPSEQVDQPDPAHTQDTGPLKLEGNLGT